MPTNMKLNDVSGNPYIPASVQSIVNSVMLDAKRVDPARVELWKERDGVWRLTYNGCVAADFLPVRSKVATGGKLLPKEDAVKRIAGELRKAVYLDAKGTL